MMMNEVPQIEPVTRMQKDHRALLEQTNQGPVVLSNRGKAAGVLLSVAEWDSIVKEMNDLRIALAMTKNALAIERKGQPAHTLSDLVAA